jgi:glycosyltransferase 2 family protein
MVSPAAAARDTGPPLRAVNAMNVREITSIALQTFAGLAVGGFFLWLALRNVDVQQVWNALRSIDRWWIAAALFAYALALTSRIVRWWTILRAVSHIRIGQVAAALLAGYAANAILPARLGELFRANFCGRRYGMSRAMVLGTIMIERLVDGIIVICALMLGLLAAGINTADLPVLYSVLATATALFGAFGFALLVLGTDLFRRLFAKYPRIALRFDAIASSLRQLRSWRIVVVLSLSVVVWVFDGAALWAVLRACGLAPSFFAVCLVIGLVSLSTLLPSPPGYMGTMQFAFALSASLMGYAASQGVAAATANQVFLLGSMVVVGLTVIVWTSGRSFFVQARQTHVGRTAFESRSER